MGFSKCHLPDIENLIKEYNELGLVAFIKSYRKYDAMVGPTESFQFLDEKKKEYELQQISLVDKGQNNQTTTS